MMLYNDDAIRVGRAIAHSIVPYSSFTAVVRQICNAVEVGNGTTIFAGVRVAAPSGTGKTLLIKYLKDNLMRSPMFNSELSVIQASLKENPTVSQVQNELLANFNYGLDGAARRANNNEINLILVKAIEQHRVRLIALDEFQHVFLTGGTKVATTVIDWLKRLMNLTGVPVILMGTEMMDRLDTVDPQLTSRIPTVVKLSPFLLNTEWVGFLQALSESISAIDLSSIHRDFAADLFRATKGSPRPLKAILTQAAMVAVNQGLSTITKEVLADAYRLQYGPSSDGGNPFAFP